MGSEMCIRDSFPKSHQSTRKPERLSEDARCFHHGEQNEDRKRAMDMGKFEDGFIEQDSMPLLQASKLAQEPIHERSEFRLDLFSNIHDLVRIRICALYAARLVRNERKT